MRLTKGRAFIAAACLAAADQATKALALAHLDPDPRGTAVRIVRGALYLKLSMNAGGVLGILEGAGPAFFIFLSAAVVAWIGLLIARLPPRDLPFAAPLALLLGGFAGNGIDRARFGRVVDFIYATWSSRGIPSTFNLADLAIGIGLVWAIALAGIRAARARRGSCAQDPAGPK